VNLTTPNKMNTQENNKMIAEFMGLSIKEGVCYYTDEDDMFPMGIEVEEPYIPYDEDWNWLMPVVNKIEEYLSANVGKVGYFDECLSSNDLDIRYNAVLEFINQFKK